jgi:hypothetical protein
LTPGIVSSTSLFAMRVLTFPVPRQCAESGTKLC